MITCTTLLKVKPASRTDFERLLTGLVDNVHKHEPLTRQFEMVRSRTDESTYLVIEQYEDQDALDYHHQMPYLDATVPAMLTHLTEPPVLESFDPVG